MKTLKVIIGSLLGIGWVLTLPSFFQNMGNSSYPTPAKIGELIAMGLIGWLVYYLFTSGGNSSGTLPSDPN